MRTFARAIGNERVSAANTIQGTLTEWLGSGLQNRVRQFDSARYLQKLSEPTNRSVRLVFGGQYLVSALPERSDRKGFGGILSPNQTRISPGESQAAPQTWPRPGKALFCVASAAPGPWPGDLSQTCDRSGPFLIGAAPQTPAAPAAPGPWPGDLSQTCDRSCSFSDIILRSANLDARKGQIVHRESGEPRCDRRLPLSEGLVAPRVANNEEAPGLIICDGGTTASGR